MKGKTISYRPTPEVEKLFNKYCGDKAILSNTQLIEIAFQYLMMQPEDSMDRVIWKFLTGKFDDNELAKFRRGK